MEDVGSHGRIGRFNHPNPDHINALRSPHLAFAFGLGDISNPRQEIFCRAEEQAKALRQLDKLQHNRPGPS